MKQSDLIKCVKVLQHFQRPCCTVIQHNSNLGHWECLHNSCPNCCSNIDWWKKASASGPPHLVENTSPHLSSGQLNLSSSEAIWCALDVTTVRTSRSWHRDMWWVTSRGKKETERSMRLFCFFQSLIVLSVFSSSAHRWSYFYYSDLSGFSFSASKLITFKNRHPLKLNILLRPRTVILSPQGY